MLRRLVVLLAFALFVAACTASSGGDTTPASTDAPVESTLADETPGTTVGETATTTTLQAPTWTDLPGVDDLPQDIQDELLDLVRVTEEIRDLVFIEPPNITVVSDAELEERARGFLEEDADDIPADEALYKLLGLLDPEADLETILIDLYGEQVGGYYDLETKELVVPATDQGFSVLQRTTLVHELTHALTDQAFDIGPVWFDLYDNDHLDQFSALQALVEGDASLAELLYLQTLSQRELGEYLAEAFQIDSSALEASPQFIQDSLIFPYDSGLAFTQMLYNIGGWDEVDDAYLTMPGLPGSTEQVITPGDFGRDLPMTVEPPSITVPGYALERRSVWGEFGFRMMFDQALGGDGTLEAVDGWGGDAYYQWFDGQNAALALFYEGDTDRDEAEMKDALIDFARSSVPDEDFVWVDEELGDWIVFIAADDPEVGAAILDSIRG